MKIKILIATLIIMLTTSNTFCMEEIKEHYGPVPSVLPSSQKKFAKTMSEHNKKWASWHKNNYVPYVDTSGEEKTIRQDTDSPYYQQGQLTDPLLNEYSQSKFNQQLTESNRPALGLNAWFLNAKENESYHNELQFLQKQKAKMELYWDTKPWYSKIFSYFSYHRQLDLLKEEIKLFKQNREAFTRSAMPKKDFEFISKTRQEYQRNNQNKE